jgi:hypothetical protein
LTAVTGLAATVFVATRRVPLALAGFLTGFDGAFVAALVAAFVAGFGAAVAAGVGPTGTAGLPVAGLGFARVVERFRRATSAAEAFSSWPRRLATASSARAMAFSRRRAAFVPDAPSFAPAPFDSAWCFLAMRSSFGRRTADASPVCGPGLWIG